MGGVSSCGFKPLKREVRRGGSTFQKEKELGNLSGQREEGRERDLQGLETGNATGRQWDESP